MLFIRILLIFLIAFLVSEKESRAQLIQTNYGKNLVVWNNEKAQYYASAHFGIYHWIDLKNDDQRYYFEQAVNELESAYEWLSNRTGHRISQNITVFLYKTHSELAGNSILPDPFLPEGVGAFAEPERDRIVLKLDFFPGLNKTIMVHELNHIFYFDMSQIGIIGNVLGRGRAQYFVEGITADFAANLFSPYIRDDIRRMIQRGIASNPEMFLPTLIELETGNCQLLKQCNPYIVGAMVAEFIYNEFGEKAYWDLYVHGSKSNKPLIEIISEVSKGKLNLGNFDTLHREFWSKRYGKDMLDKQRPYHENDNFTGKLASSPRFPIYNISPVLSPDGSTLTCLTVDGDSIAVVTFPSGSVIYPTRVLGPVLGDLGKKLDPNKNQPKVLFKTFPPKPYEYLVAQELVTWPFNGSDLDWSRDGKIAFFAQKNRDHILVIINSETGKVEKEIELPLDQAFSPAFSQNGEKLYLSASSDIVRDIYVYNLKTGSLENVTRDRAFDTAPAVSPDGNWLAYLSYTGDFQKLFLLDLRTGYKRQITFNRYNDGSPSWSDDGRYIVYTSDDTAHQPEGRKNERVWNLYTLEVFDKEGQLLEEMIARQWTDFFGGVFTPKFAKDDSNKVYYMAYWQYDQIGPILIPNFKIYEADLKKPFREFPMKNIGETTDWNFGREDLFKTTLSSQQLEKPLDFPEKWRFRPNQGGIFGYNTYWGAFTALNLSFANILETKRHAISFASSGSYRFTDYQYVNTGKRWLRAYGVSDLKIPLYYMHYDLFKSYPKQQVLNHVVMSQTTVGGIAAYPFTKFERIEVGASLRKSNFEIFNYDPQQEAEPQKQDLSLYDFFNRSKGHSLDLKFSFIKDTIVGSNEAQGIWHGNAFSFTFTAAPPIGGDSLDYLSIRTDMRRYQRITSGSLLALRGVGVWNSDSNGEYIMVGGNSEFRGYPYASIVGNRLLFGSAELRFPLIDAVLFPGRFGIGPFRGLLFTDAGLIGFNDKDSLLRKEMTYGFGLQFFQIMPLNFVWSKRHLDNFKDLKFDVYIGFNW